MHEPCADGRQPRLEPEDEDCDHGPLQHEEGLDLDCVPNRHVERHRVVAVPEGASGRAPEATHQHKWGDDRC